MKANVTRDKDGHITKKVLVVKKEDVSKLIKDEWNEKWEEQRDKVYEVAKRDVSAQVLAVFFTVMNKEHGWGKKRLEKLKSDVEAYFKLMQTGIFNKSFSLLDCIEYIKNEYGIDLDNEEIIK